MSGYSGKCDLFDSIEIDGDRLFEETTKIYINNIGPIRNSCKEDLLPYYPYIVHLMSRNDKEIYINLSEKSYVDTSEEETLERMLQDVIRLYKKAKRTKVKFTKDYVLSNLSNYIFNWDEYSKIYSILTERVSKDGDKASFEGLHTSIGNFYRNLLYGAAVKANLELHPLIINVRRAILDYEAMINYED